MVTPEDILKLPEKDTGGEGTLVTPEDILKEHPGPVQHAAQLLRELVLSTAPEMTERAYPGWHGIGYRHPQNGYVCGIFPNTEGVKLLFEQGVQLPDPHKMLQGNGKQTRYLEVSHPDDIPEDAVRLFLVEAIELSARLPARPGPTGN